jgi:hypothetical protein
LRVRILLRAAKMFPVGTPDYDEIDELTTMINHKVGFKRIDFEKMTEKAIEKLKSRKDKIIMKKLLESLYTLANERGLGPSLFMGRTETEMASKNWANIFHAAVVAKKLNLENAPKEEQDAARAAARLIYAHRNHPYDVEAPASVLCRMLGPVKCKMNLKTAINRKELEVPLAMRILSHGRAGSLCDQVGPWQCHESLAKAKALGHSSIIAAISATQFAYKMTLEK